MNFNIKKYDKIKFHSNPLLNKRVKALYLWFDYEVEKRDLNKKGQILLIDEWIKALIRFEYYEVVPFFKGRRYDILRAIVKEKNANMSDLDHLVSFLKKIKNKIRRFARGFILKK